MYFLAKPVRLVDSPLGNSKRQKIVVEESFEDIPEKLVAEIFQKVEDPSYMTGPDVSVIFPKS